MELGSSPSPELLTAADPLSRGPPAFARPPRPGGDANSGLPSFELLLGLLGNALPLPLPAGQTLPVSGAAPAPTAYAATPTSETPALPPEAAPPTAALASTPPSSAPALHATVSGPAAATGEAAARAAIADALRALTGEAQPVSADEPDGTSQTAASLRAGSAAFDAPPDAVPGAHAAAGREPEAAADLRLALAAARAGAPVPADAVAFKPRLTEESRPRAVATPPLARAAWTPSDLAPADAGGAARADAPLRAADSQPAVDPRPAPLNIAQPAEPLPIEGATAGTAGADSATAAGGVSSLAPHSTATAHTQSAGPAHGAQPPTQHGAPLDTQSARWHDALASRVQWLVDHEIGEARIKLNPPELGALDVKISLVDDKTYVQMTAHTPAARDELAQGLPRLRELMSAGGIDLGGATVSGGHDGRGGQHAEPPIVRSAAYGADTPEAAMDFTRPASRSASRIDLFA